MSFFYINVIRSCTIYINLLSSNVPETICPGYRYKVVTFGIRSCSYNSELVLYTLSTLPKPSKYVINTSKQERKTEVSVILQFVKLYCVLFSRYFIMRTFK